VLCVLPRENHRPGLADRHTVGLLTLRQAVRAAYSHDRRDATEVSAVARVCLGVPDAGRSLLLPDASPCELRSAVCQ
jgi:hypothetical protein